MATSDKYKRISRVTATLMVGVAVFCDLIELLLDLLGVGIIVSYIIDIAAFCIFPLWFMMKGANLSSPRAAARFWAPMVGELLPIPVLDFFLTTMGVILLIKQTWEEDSGSKDVNVLRTTGRASKRLARMYATGRVPLGGKK